MESIDYLKDLSKRREKYMASYIKRLPSCISLIMVMMFGLIRTTAANEEVVLHFISSETPPFWSRSLYLDGMCGEMLHEISKEIGVKAVIEYQPTARMIEGVGNNLLGNPDLFLSSHDFKVILPIAVSRLAIFYYKPNHKKGINYKRLEDLKGYTIGIMKGSLSNADISYFREYGIKFEESYSKRSLFKKLKLGRIDLCIVIELSGLLVINRYFPDEAYQFKRFKIQRSITPITVMIANNYPNGERLGKNIKRGLEMVINSGKYYKILEKYYGKENIPNDWYKHLVRYRKMYDLSLSTYWGPVN
jgi:polar amino acid transport system substrate-binding protein